MKIRKQNVFNTIWAFIKFISAWIYVFINAIILCFIPRGKLSVRYMQFFMRQFNWFMGVRYKIKGKLSTKRPLLCVCNHISVFEISTMAAALGGSFFGKKDIESWPLIGWMAKKFGVVFIDRRPSHAIEALNAIQKELDSVDYPLFIFPEGTSTNGAYVKQFKSSMFDVVEKTDVTVQPVVVHYRLRDGTKINDEDMANHFAYFDNKKMDCGPYCKRERSVFMQVFHIMMLGGFLVDIEILPVPDLSGMDRKEMADALHKIISDKYMKNK
ncbi:MAG: 1-acyl-sn-glycerol-3-phosphate acyltransferase [Alphaproteobacteria bacterium]|nr:1-acyl-sn-glycerol-3-phosphate acyltransferase [Alphaproteobacteria bacterium]